MMFLKYAAGERGWHAVHHYANLTIDDPRLQQPYGLLDYERLLSAMETHRYHTTIAFIPWNYDRSESRVISLIREHPDRFSISIHGDNHDHREFTTYDNKPLGVQMTALRQALARMEQFRALTGIPYDKVMVFPHAIAPENTLSALNDYGYLATVNSSNVPLGSTPPESPLFYLRSITLRFGAFPSLLRYSVAAPLPTYLIGLQSFLDNPLLFYCHHDFFLDGVDAFNKIAHEVNTRDPHIRWASLADVVRHFYLVKVRDDRSYDVLAYSSEIDLENVSKQEALFHIRKMESGRLRISSVVADNRSYPFSHRDGVLYVAVAVPAGQTSRVKVEYERVPFPAVNIDRRSRRVYIIRMASEFRDNVLYRNFAGRTLINVYYRSGGAYYVMAAALAIIAAFIYIGCRVHGGQQQRKVSAGLVSRL
jgi:hypothetical protein